MLSQPETMEMPVTGTLQQFNRYGLPGLVIGAQFLIIAGLLYFGLGAINKATDAMAQMTGALHELNQTIRDMKK